MATSREIRSANAKQSIGMKPPAILLGLFGIAILALGIVGAAAGLAFHVGSKQ